jgi:histidinol-phosphate aminotransferase
MTLPYALNPVLESLPVYQPGRPIESVARELGLDPAGIIKLASNENPLGPSPRALAAMRDAIEAVHLYPDGNAFNLKEELARHLGIGPGQLVLGNGSNDVLELVGHALIQPETEVVVSEYCFAVYPIVTRLFGGQLVSVPARAYGHDLDAMLAAVTPRTRLMFVANPNNPTGTLAPPEAVETLIAGLPAGVVLVMDEAYIEYMEEALDLLPRVRSGKWPNLLLTRTFSKIHGLAGLRVGYGIGHPKLIAALEAIRQPFNVNLVAQAAARAALTDTEHMDRTRRNNGLGLHQIEQGCRALGLDFVPSSANFLLVQVGKGQQCFEFLQRQGVIVRPMGGYGLPEWIRISVGTPEENRRCLDALRRSREN